MENESEEVNIEERKRGFWLSAFLILMFIVNPLSAAMYFLAPETILALYPSASVVLIYFLGVMCLLNVVFAINIWRWKKIGIQAFYGIVALAFVLNLYIGVGLAGSLSGLIGGIIIFLLTRNKMQHFS